VNVRRVGGTEVCFCENDEVGRVGTGHDEDWGPFTVGETVRKTLSRGEVWGWGGRARWWVWVSGWKGGGWSW
jgi:hypothetical protein